MLGSATVGNGPNRVSESRGLAPSSVSLFGSCRALEKEFSELLPSLSSVRQSELTEFCAEREEFGAELSISGG